LLIADIFTMMQSLPDLIKRNPRVALFAFVLPLIAACAVLIITALVSLANSRSYVEEPPSPDPAPAANSTLNGGEIGNTSISIREISPENSDNFENRAVLRGENEIILYSGGSSSCPTNFTSITNTDDTITLDTRAGEDLPNQACTADYHIQVFHIISETPIEADSVTLDYTDERSTVVIPIDREGSTDRFAKPAALVSNGNTVRELELEEVEADPAASALVANFETPSAVVDAGRGLFTVGGSSSCPIAFEAANPNGAQLVLLYTESKTGPGCTRDFQTRVFEVTAGSGFGFTEILLQPVDASQESQPIPVSELPTV
jgi:hypothetical protein